jgi:hypothetical protein
VSGEISWLASPVIGGGVMLGRFQQMFVSAIFAGRQAPSDWAQHAWAQLQAQGERIVVDGKALMTPQENLAALSAQADTFAAGRLKLLKVLGVV